MILRLFVCFLRFSTPKLANGVKRRIFAFLQNPHQNPHGASESCRNLLSAALCLLAFLRCFLQRSPDNIACRHFSADSCAFSACCAGCWEKSGCGCPREFQYPMILYTPVRSSGGYSANCGASTRCPGAAYLPLRFGDGCGFAPCRNASSVSSDTIVRPLTLLDGSFPSRQYR